jgi:hypothetical protein
MLRINSSGYPGELRCGGQTWIPAHAGMTRGENMLRETLHFQSLRGSAKS